MRTKMCCSRSNFLKVTRNTAKFQTDDFENQGQGHLQSSEVRRIDVPHLLANTFRYYVSKFCRFEESANRRILFVIENERTSAAWLNIGRQISFVNVL